LKSLFYEPAFLACALLYGCLFAVQGFGYVEPTQQSSPQASKTASVSPVFQPEVARLEREGLKLVEAVEADLGAPGTHHLAAVFRREKPKDPSQTCEFRIIEADTAGVRTVFRRGEFHFSFGTLENNSRLNATDINKDGLKEVLVQSSSGGNCWACNPTEIYQVRDRKVELVAAAPISRIADLDGDGIQDLVVTDTRWEAYDDLSHAAAPGAPMVYTWKSGRYVYASRDFGAFYGAEVERLRREIEAEKAEVTDVSDDSYVGKVISLAVTFAHMGEPAKGLIELESRLKTNQKTRTQAEHRQEILEDFRAGESAKRLREMKYGDPLPQ
jgi:hypothetical protein